MLHICAIAVILFYCGCDTNTDKSYIEFCLRGRVELGRLVLGVQLGLGEELGRPVVDLGELGPAVGGCPVGDAPRLKFTVPMGAAPSSTDLSAIKTIRKTSPSDSLLFQGIFTMVYTWSSWFWMISARQIFKFGVRTGNDSIMVHPASLTSLLISSLISPLKPPFYFLTTVVLLCSPIVTGNYWSTRIIGEAEGTHIMLNISIWRKYKRFARKTDSTDLHVFWLHARLTQTHPDHNASVQIFCRREPTWLSCVAVRSFVCRMICQ